MSRIQAVFAVHFIAISLAFISYGILSSPPAVVPDYIASVVVKGSEGGKYNDLSTGVYLSHELVLTAAHNIRDHKGVSELLVDGLHAEVIYKNDQEDFALLGVPGSFRVSPFPKLSTDLSGKLTTCGYIGGTRYHEYHGIQKQGRWLTAEVRQGMSGGPVINEVGDVVGSIIGAGAGRETFISDITVIIAKLRELGLHPG